MAAITPTINLLALSTPALDTQALEFGDSTTGKFGTGEFGSTSFTVAITGDVQSVQIRRGRDTFLGRSEPGTCSITVRNDRANAGDYDPQNPASPYYPLLSAASVQVLIGGISLFVGSMSGLPVAEEPPNQSVVSFEAKERSTRFSSTRTAYWERYSGAPIDLIAGQIERAVLAADRDADITIDASGGVSIPIDVDDVGTRTQVDEIIADIECTDGGLFSVQADGSYLYLGSNQLAALSSSLTVSDAAGATVRYSAVERGSVFDRITNTVTFQRSWDYNPPTSNWPTDRDPQWVDDASVYRYGTHEVQCNLYPSGSGANALDSVEPSALRILAEGAYPQETVIGVTIPTARYDVFTQAAILIIDIGSVISVRRDPPGASATTVAYVVIGIEHDISPKQHTTTFRLAPQPS